MADVLGKEMQRRAFVDTGRGRMRYLVAGSGSPILLIHGLVGSAENWQPNMDALAQHGCVYALDLPNMGLSDRQPDDPAMLSNTAEQLICFMDALGLASATVVAHSHGGTIALTLAALFPKRVDRLILFAPANPFCDRSRGLRRFYTSWVGQRFASTIPVLPRRLKRLAHQHMYGNPSRTPEAALAGYTDGLRVRGTIRHILQIVGNWEQNMADLRAWLRPGLSTPSLLIWGDRDRAVGLDSAQQLRRRLPHSELLVMPGVGHLPFEEEPGLSNAAMLHWLRRTAPVAERAASATVGVTTSPRPWRTRHAATAGPLAASPSA